MCEEGVIWNQRSSLTTDRCCVHPAGNPAEFQDSSDHHTFKKMLPRDERRFKASDLDGDLTATREEFTAFLHPEEFEHMKEIVVLVRTVKMQTGPGPGRKLSPHLVPVPKERLIQPAGNWGRTEAEYVKSLPREESGQAFCCNKCPN